MTTVRDCLEQAYRRFGVVGVGETMPDDLAAHALDAFNNMLLAAPLAAWEGSAAAPYAASDDYPLDLSTLEPVIYLLAARLAPDFKMQIGFDPMVYERRLQAAALSIDTLAMPTFRTLNLWTI